ncbi:MAG: DNA translocase FtsK [Chloroflexi bacterium]|nr:DNA translocase FtsK [Chloroflexota bacterium]
MKTRARPTARKAAKKKPWQKRAFTPDRVKSYLGYALALMAVALLIVVAVRWGPPLAEGFLAGVVSLFGVGVFLLLAAALLVGLYMAGGERLRSRWRPKTYEIVGAAILGLFVFGLLAFVGPNEASLGGQTLKKVAAGGDLGTLVRGSPDFLGFLRVLGLGIVGFATVTPSGAKAVLAALARGSRALASRGGTALRAWSARRREARDRSRAVNSPGNVTGQAASIDAAAEEDIVYEVPARTLEAKKARAETVAPARAEATNIGSALTAMPPIDLLEKAATVDLSKVDIKQRVKHIEDKLAEYGVDARVVEVNQGPAFTQFGIEPGWDVKVREVKDRDLEGRIKYDRDGKPLVHLEEISRTRVKVSRITALANDLAMALAAPTIRIEAPVPGKSMVGIEVPNVSAAVVSLRSVIESPPFQRMKPRSKLALALGQGVEGDAVAGDLAKMPHLLIAGATGSGKSVCINSIITCLLMHANPEEVRLLMVDPKRVELIAFEGVPHLVCPVVVEMTRVVGILRWVAKEMDERYRQFAEIGARNIQSYNDKMAKAEKKGLPYLVVVIDELADLMMLAADEVERIICRLAQLARATGIHLVIATQRPSVDVVTGLIKANIPTRISFAVTSQVDSRTILDMGGAEKLLGRGDMLYMPTDAAKPIRLQGAFLSDAEIETLVAWWKNQRPANYIDELVNMPEWAGEGAWEDSDPKLEEARRLVEQGTQPSVSLLQRRLRVGYNRAKRIMEQLQDEGLADEAGGEEGFTRFST